VRGRTREARCASFDTGRRRTLLAFLQDFNSASLFSSTAKLDEIRSKNEAHSSLPSPPPPAPRSLFVNLPASFFSLLSSRVPSSHPPPLARCKIYEENDEASVLLCFLDARTFKGLAGCRPLKVSPLLCIISFSWKNNVAITF